MSIQRMGSGGGDKNDIERGGSSPDSNRSAGVRLVGRYALLGKLASGGMATVHVGRLLGSVGFTRMVAVKRLHPEYARDPEFVSMFLDEARLAAQISHPNVVSTLDVVATGGELYLVMEYIHGQSLSWLIKNAARTGQPIPPRIVAAIVSGCLQGLHAAHEARNERGAPLNIVHRDVSPQNVMLGADGLARVLDFGVAKAVGRSQNTREGTVKGKLAYMPPEQLQTDFITRQADIYSTSVVLWEALTLTRLFKGETEGATLAKILAGTVPRPSEAADWVPPEFDAVVMKGLERDAEMRYATAREMASALERCGNTASTAEVADWLEHVAKGDLDDRAARITAIEMGAGLNTDGPDSGEQHLATALSATTAQIDEESSSSVVLRRAKAANAETRVASKPALEPVPAIENEHVDLEESLTVPVDMTDAVADEKPNLGGDAHMGENASQLSSVSVAMGSRAAPALPARDGSLLGAVLVGATAALLVAGLWISGAGRSARSSAVALPPPAQAITPPSTSVTPVAPGEAVKPTNVAANAVPSVDAGVQAPPADAPAKLDKQHKAGGQDPRRRPPILRK